jgi:hemolysin-activating ACP:hemolysin acyltransferase
MAPLLVSRYGDPAAALGAACHLLARLEPYAGYGFGPVTRTLAAQIKRGHYLFVRRERTTLAYAGWALCRDDVAERWISGDGAPDFAACVEGPAVVLVVVASVEATATRRLIRAARELAPGRRIYFRRAYEDGRSARPGTVANLRSAPEPGAAARSDDSRPSTRKLHAS